MQLNLNITLTKPSSEHKQLFEAVGIKEVLYEDVSHFQVEDNGIKVFFNDKTDVFLPLRGNDSIDGVDWRAMNIFITRKFLTLDMSK